MKEKKLYKIAFMGDKDHGCDIISTLESWGSSNHYLRTGSDPEYAYFINDLGMIDFIHNSALLSEEMKNFYFLFWHDYNIECNLKVGETINYSGQDYDVDSILFDANNRRIVYKLKSFGIGVEYITNNELTPTEEWQAEEENNEYLCKNNMKRKLAIRGHATRGKEVIELLGMLGAKNNCDSPADNLGLCYLIDDEFNICAHYFGYDDYEDGELNIFTLEEFLEKYPFKVGDKVFLYDNITEGCVTGIEWDEDKGTVKYCVYTSSECWCDVKDLLKWNTINLVEKHYADQCDEMDKTMSMLGHTLVPDKVGNNLEYNIINDYEFDRVENGKIILKPIKPKYPKTYEECCEVLGIGSYFEPEIRNATTEECHIFMKLMRLKRCRDAYWKIAGEEMGLNRPWEPDWKNSEERRYCIVNIEGDINLPEKILTKWILKVTNKILVFPTEEMRDAFYENFKKEIKICKELL